MPGETREDVSGWTVDTLNAAMSLRIFKLEQLLLERFETQQRMVDVAFQTHHQATASSIAATDKAVAAALLSAEKAVSKAENANEKRFEGVNEFRAQLNDQQRNFITRVEANSRIDGLAEKFEAEAARNAQRFSEGINRINDVDSRLSSRLDLTQGKSTGISASSGVALALVTLLATLMTVAIVIANFVG